jgi:hypothetical protein
MTVLSQNSYPLNILNRLGIEIPGLTKSEIKLPEAMANYLDTIIREGDQSSLTTLAPQLITGAEKIALENPRVAFNALSALKSTNDKEAGADMQSTADGANVAALQNIARYNSSQKQIYARIAANIGIKDNGLAFEIINRENYNQFLESAKTTIGLEKDQKDILNQITNDDLFTLSLQLNSQESPITTEELSAYRVSFIKLRNLGLDSIEFESGKELSVNKIIAGIAMINSNPEQSEQKKKLLVDLIMSKQN